MKITDQVFLTTFDRTIGHEGGFTNDPNDRGNWTGGRVGSGLLKGTKFGISAMTYPSLDIKNLTVEDARQIYYAQWWVQMRMERMHKSLRFQLFDAAINHSMLQTNKMLQRAIKVNDDGIIGPISLNAIVAKDHNDVLMLFLAERLIFMTNVSTWNLYSKGWSRRIASNLQYAAKDN